MAHQKVWTTKSVDETIEKYRSGLDVDLSFFHERNIMLKGSNITFILTPEEEAEFAKCSGDIEYFVENYCKFMTDRGLKTVELHPYQGEILNICGGEEWLEHLEEFGPKNRNFILMASRQTGKTTTISAYFAWYLCFHTDRNLAILANKQATAVEIVRKVTEVFKGLPYYLKPGIESIGALGMRLDNGCMLSSQATTENAQIGFTIHVLYIDEFAHIRPTVTGPFWRSVYPTLASSEVSQCIISSTPNGKENLFYDIWEKSVTGKNTFVNKRVDYWEFPGHDTIKWIEETKSNFGEEFFSQEFELKFDVTTNSLLSASQLKWLKRLSKIYKYSFKELEKTELDEGLYRNLRWREDFDPNKIIDPREDRFVISVDIAEGKEEEEKKDNDYNVAMINKVSLKSLAQLKKIRKDERQIENMFRIEQIGVYSDNVQDETELAKVCESIVFDQFESTETTIVKMIVEMNFNGKAFLNKFQENENYFEDLVMRSHHTAPVPGQVMPPKKPGFKQRSDKDYFCKLAKKLVGKKTIISTDEKTYNEFSNFGRVKNKWKGIASHDDLVISMVNIARLYEEKEEYQTWLYDFLDNMPDSLNKRYALMLLDQADESTDIGDENYSGIYSQEYELSEAEKIVKIFSEMGQVNKASYKPGSTLNKSYGR